MYIFSRERLGFGSRSSGGVRGWSEHTWKLNRKNYAMRVLVQLPLFDFVKDNLI